LSVPASSIAPPRGCCQISDGDRSREEQPTEVPRRNAVLVVDDLRPDVVVATVRHIAGLAGDDAMSFPRASHIPRSVMEIADASGSADRGQAVVDALEDEELAGRTGARLLITAANGAVETVARRVHGGSRRAAFPFVRVWAGELPEDPVMLRETCVTLLEAAPGGSMFITDVEDMPPIVQDVLVELLVDLQGARAPSDAVRVITATSVSLLDRVAAGTFSERLFYRLNLIHLVAPDRAPWVASHASIPSV